MATLAETFAADFKAQRDDLPTTFTFSGADYTGSFTELRTEKDMLDGAYSPQGDGELGIALDEFATAPALNDTLTIASVSYRVQARSNCPSGATATLTLVRSN